MVSNLESFGYRPENPNYRERTRTSFQPFSSVYAYGRFWPALASGSYRRIIDQVKGRVSLQSLRNQRAMRRTYPEAWFPDVFFDVGGPLWIEDVSISTPSVHLDKVYAIGSWVLDKWSGPVIGSSDHYQLYADLAAGKAIKDSLRLSGVSFSDMVVHGTTGISRSIPNIPSVSVFTILGELREGIATFPGHQMAKALKETRKWSHLIANAFQGSGSEFLNFMFGIKPTLNDVNDLLLLNTEGIKKVRQKLNSDADVVYRRKRTLKDEVTTETTETTGFCQLSPSGWIADPGVIRTVVETHTKIWFSGAFNHSAWKPTMNAQLNELLRGWEDLGLLPNAERLWQLIPYSWLVDWFANTGEILTNISYLGHSGLTLLYGYVMADTSRTTTVTFTGSFLGEKVSSTTVLRERVRQRIKASPYGFGLKIGDLSPTQLAILASLGISRTRLLKSGTMS